MVTFSFKMRESLSTSKRAETKLTGGFFTKITNVMMNYLMMIIMMKYN